MASSGKWDGLSVLHPHRLSYGNFYPDGGFNCDMCDRSYKDKHWHCLHDCLFDLCSTCFKLSRFEPDDSQQSCSECKAMFTVVRRRHHCRICGGLFCAACSSLRVKAVRDRVEGTEELLRACDQCKVFHDSVLVQNPGLEFGEIVADRLDELAQERKLRERRVMQALTYTMELEAHARLALQLQREEGEADAAARRARAQGHGIVAADEEEEQPVPPGASREARSAAHAFAQRETMRRRSVERRLEEAEQRHRQQAEEAQRRIDALQLEHAKLLRAQRQQQHHQGTETGAPSTSALDFEKARLQFEAKLNAERQQWERDRAQLLRAAKRQSALDAARAEDMARRHAEELARAKAAEQVLATAQKQHGAEQQHRLDEALAQERRRVRQELEQLGMAQREEWERRKETELRSKLKLELDAERAAAVRKREVMQERHAAEVRRHKQLLEEQRLAREEDVRRLEESMAHLEMDMEGKLAAAQTAKLEASVQARLEREMRDDFVRKSRWAWTQKNTKAKTNANMVQAWQDANDGL